MTNTSFEKLANLFGMCSRDFFLLIKNPSIYYCDYTIPKRNGGVRHISSPTLQLMAIQREILKQILLPKFKAPSCCTGFVKNKNIIDNVKPHLKNIYVLKMDVKDFFPSIKQQQVQKLFETLEYSKKVSSILARLCCRYGSIPQGAPTSPILSNMVMQAVDEKIVQLCDNYNFVYTRYADDITISSNNEINPDIALQIQKFLAEDGFEVKKEKTHFYGKNSKKIITGVSISSGVPKLPRKTKRAWHQEIMMIKKHGILGHMDNISNYDPLFIASMLGKISFWKQIEPDNPFLDEASLILKKAIEDLS